MSHRRAAVVAWGLCALTLTAAALAAALSAGVADTDWAAILPEATPPDEGIFTALLDVAWLVAFAVIGAFVASHRPANPVGWLLRALPALLVLNFLGESYYWHAAHDEPQRPAPSRSSGSGSPTFLGPSRDRRPGPAAAALPDRAAADAAVADRPLGGARRRARPLRRRRLRARPAGELPVGRQPARARGDAAWPRRGRRDAVVRVHAGRCGVDRGALPPRARRRAGADQVVHRSPRRSSWLRSPSRSRSRR